MTHPADNLEFQCWVCQLDIPAGKGIDVGESGEEICCESCWEEIPPQWRLMLGLVFRQQQDGGLGLAELFAKAKSTWPLEGFSRN